MLLGYNTNGFANHALEGAIEVLAALGYRAVAITVDHHALNPRGAGVGEQVARVRRLARKHGLRVVVETGARYLLDPLRKHEPTLVSPTREARDVRVAFLAQCIDLAAELRADCVSIWSGVVHDGAGLDEATARLDESLAQGLAAAARLRVPLAFEPEPGMLVETVADYAALKERLAAHGVPTDLLGLTVDVGHLVVNGEPVVASLEEGASDLLNVHLDDSIPVVHEHLMPGDGDLDFDAVFGTLARIGYEGCACVELSRHSHDAPLAARRALERLEPLVTPHFPGGAWFPGSR
ncbi:MAG: sugar phosphate isomerase/epimerase family protein [Lacipirellulaceae bacterium]